MPDGNEIDFYLQQWVGVFLTRWRFFLHIILNVLAA
jgi:hypothetical protein